MNKNKAFFANKSWEQVFSELKFDNHYKKLCKKLKNKKVVFYGAGVMFDFFFKKYNTEQLNIVGIADKSFVFKKPDEYKDYDLLSPEEMAAKDVDAIVISILHPVAPRNFLKYQIYKNKKLPKVYFLLNKPFELYFEEIFNTL